MTDKYESQMRKVRAARIKMVSDHPFFGDLAFGMPIEFNDQIKPATAQTNGSKIVFHPGFVDELDLDEVMFTLAHEVMHPALHHNYKRGNRDMKRWQIACDIVVNQKLVESGIGRMPKGGVYDPDKYWKGNGKVEGIYELVPDQGDDDTWDECQDGEPGSEEDKAAEWRNKLNQALQTAKKAGNVPGGMEEFVDNLTNPKVRWQDKLRNFCMPARGKDRTYTKVNRRHAESSVILPGYDGERMGELAWLIDCSGSTSDAMVGRCGGELNSIQEELRPEKIHVLYFDTEVKKHEEYEPDDPLVVKAYGRGGTCFRTSFEYMKEKGIVPECCIVATDLDCYDYGPDPGFPVLWVVLEGSYYQKPPWGEVLTVDQEN